MAKKDKIKEVVQRINAIWAEINFLLSDKKKDNSDGKVVSALQKVLAQKTHELRQLKARQLKLNHSYSVILVGDFIEKDGGISVNYPLNVEVSTDLDCGLRDLTRLDERKEVHLEFLQQLKEKHAQQFSGGAFKVAYIIQIQ